MKIWQLKNTLEEYDMIQLKDFKYHYEKYFDPGFKGKSMINDWPPIEVVTIQEGKKSDVPLCSPSVPVFSGKAIAVLKDLLDGSVELLPLVHNNYIGLYKLYAVNVIDLRDCIDYSRSERKIYSTGKLGGFTKYVFKSDAIKDAHIFKIKDFPFTAFYSDEFRERALNSKLHGFKFEEVWNSES